MKPNNVQRARRPRRIRNTRVDLLIAVLADGQWHSTKELVRRVGHTFGGAKFHLAHTGIHIQRRRHPRRRFQHEYRVDIGAPRVDGPSQPDNTPRH